MSLPSAVAAPAAPGRLGQRSEPAAVLAYLDGLGRWRDARKLELDALDQAALEAAPGSLVDPAGVTADIALSMALWKAVADRYEALLKVWDSGRAGGTELLRISSLVWGRLDATIDPTILARSAAVPSTGMAVSLPEACRLSDALAVQLRARLSLGGAALDVAERIRTLRATMERVRDQVDLEPAGAAQQQAASRSSDLARRLKELLDKAARGGDVGGLIGPLESEAVIFERDLIVRGVQRREAAALVPRARGRLAEVSRRAIAVRELADRCVATVDPAPKYAVPEVAALGPLPNVAGSLRTFLGRLDQVDKALDVAERAYGDALARRTELSSRLDGYGAKAAALGVADEPDLARAFALARECLNRTPTQLVIAEQLVTLYQTYLSIALPAPARQETR